MARGSATGLDELVSVPELARDPGWARLLAAARRRLERTGGSLDGAVTIVAPTDAERRVVISVTGVHRSASARRLSVRLRDVDRYLTQTHGRGLVALVGVADRPGGRRPEPAAREAFVSLARSSRHADREWFDRWLTTIDTDGTLARATRSGRDLTPVLRVLDALPAADEPLPAFAERVLSDSKALRDATLRRLVLRAVATWRDLPAPTTAEQERSAWESVGVVPDDLASQVLVLNIPAAGGDVARFLGVAAAVGMPVRITLNQLRTAPIEVHARELFVTENAAVLRAASTLGAASPPLVCTEGMPSAAANRLLGGASGAVLYWRNDLDWPGVRTTAAALERYPAAVPWRMAATDYLAVAGDGPELSGEPAPTPWDERLSLEMRRVGRAVMEDRLLPVLLDDLRSASR
jgi:uncharacterized protein (TIGR02679 family)